MESKFTLVDWIVTLGFALACLAIGIGLRAAICAKHQTKEETESSLTPPISQPHSTKP